MKKRMNCTRMIRKKDEFILFFKSSYSANIASAANKLINTVPQTAATTFAFSSMYKSFF